MDGSLFQMHGLMTLIFAYIYNANTEKEQVSVLKELTTILSNFENIDNHNFIFSGDFVIFFDASLYAQVGTPTLKSRSINKLIELNEMLDLRDIWRTRNPKNAKHFPTKTFIWNYTTTIRLHSPRIC